MGVRLVLPSTAARAWPQARHDVVPALERRHEVAPLNRSAELEVALYVERQLEALVVSLPSLSELRRLTKFDGSLAD